ncbi:MAG: hypothetical protein GY862_09680, partial [Gammaproteobacteria bacterium]|nr:hypothetical protein [Gammaproteobacteria bacterium]
MNKDNTSEFFLWILFNRLRKGHFPLAPEDYQELYRALQAGFGWQSRDDLRTLCCALWAKSLQERKTLFSLFDDLVDEFGLGDWRLPEHRESGPVTDSPQTPFQEKTTAFTGHDTPPVYEKTALKESAPEEPVPEESAFEEPAYEESVSEKSAPSSPQVEPESQKQKDTSDISINSLLTDLDASSHSHPILNPRYILEYRQVAQAARRLRRFTRSGPKTELDIAASIALRCRRGVVMPLVFKARQRNAAMRLLLLADRQGSMSSFHHFCDTTVLRAIRQSSRFEQVSVYYFHNVPAGKRCSHNNALLQLLTRHIFPVMDDEAIADIKALEGGYLYTDPKLLQARPLSEVLKQEIEKEGAVIILSDAGAARGNDDIIRLVDTVAFLKKLHTHTSSVVWLNPLSR